MTCFKNFVWGVIKGVILKQCKQRASEPACHSLTIRAHPRKRTKWQKLSTNLTFTHTHTKHAELQSCTKHRLIFTQRPNTKSFLFLNSGSCKRGLERDLVPHSLRTFSEHLGFGPASWRNSCLERKPSEMKTFSLHPLSFCCP